MTSRRLGGNITKNQFEGRRADHDLRLWHDDGDDGHGYDADAHAFARLHQEVLRKTVLAGFWNGERVGAPHFLLQRKRE